MCIWFRRFGGMYCIQYQGEKIGLESIFSHPRDVGSTKQSKCSEKPLDVNLLATDFFFQILAHLYLKCE
jgi:hypothetical protein